MTNIPNEIVRLYKLGLAIHWLRPKSKMPVEKGWTKGPRKKLSELKSSYSPGLNYGVRLGAASKIDDTYLAVLDVDVKSEDPKHEQEARTALLKLYPKAKNAAVLKSGRGNGSSHYYVRVKKPASGSEIKARSLEIVKVKMPSVPPSQKERDALSIAELNHGVRLRPAWEVSLLSEGRQTVLVGSVHPDTGSKYTWEKPLQSIDDVPLITSKSTKDAIAGIKDTDFEDVKERRVKTNFVSVDVHNLGLRPEQILAVTEGLGVKDRSAEVFSLCMALLQRGISEERILSLFTRKDYYLGNVAYDHAHTVNRTRAANWIKKYCLSKAKLKVNDIPFDIQELPKSTQKKKEVLPQGIKEADGWEADLETRPGAKGKAPIVKATYINLRLILANRCENPNFLENDKFSLMDMYCCRTPWGSKKGDERSAGLEDALKVKSWLSSEYGIEPSISVIEEVLNTVSLEHSNHPLRDYLNGLKWDGVQRVENAFKTYLGATMQEPYLTEVTRKFFMACVKRAFEPGCKFDYVVVLEGFQGLGKSTFADTLAGKNWFLDALPNLADKDAALYLQGAWICELSELAAIFKTGNETVKGFIARKIDRFRPPYGRRRMNFPRTTVFMGTTNSYDYLTDKSGNRRWWPIFVKQCDFAGIERDRDQLWAEAMFMYTYADEPLYLVGEAKKQSVLIQELRRVEDEGDLMNEKLKSWLSDPKNFTGGIHIGDLFDGPFSNLAQSPGNMRQAAEILRKAGFKKVHTMHGNKWTCD